MHVLSIQSQVAYGHVGNSAAVFPLQCLGHEVWPIPTAVLSNHAAYPDMAGSALAPDALAALIAGVGRRGAFSRCDLVVSGYLGTRAAGLVVAEALGRMRAARGDLVYCCDPVLGDRDSGLYAAADLPGFFRRHALPAADIVTPNLFELEVLAETPPGALAGAPAADIVARAEAVRARLRPGGRVLVTSAVHRDIGPARTAMMALDAHGAFLVETPALEFPVAPHGAGDLASALFAVSCAETGSSAAALEASASAVHAVLGETARRGGGEMALVAARGAIVSPPQRFAARRIA